MSRLSELEALIQTAAQWIAEGRRLVVSTGAGVSRESGIPTFRDASSGLWARYDPQQLASVEGFSQDPKLVWQWYVWRRKKVYDARPNPGHLALARLEQLVPGLMLITQNVDGLHQRAGSSRPIELHGSITRVRCFALCGEVYENWSDEDYEGVIPPRCKSCGSLLRPDVVWFGEQLPAQALQEAFQAADTCDVMVVAGTSGLVQPAASLPVSAHQAGARVIEVNPQPSAVSAVADIVLQGKSGEILPRLVAAVEGL
ncbi:MAG: NAD-dependent deacylase [Gemmatimonadota bacterium]|nr:NAD-dependent deacylase [Gemmatimonadota bacterium]